jgi:HEAT repeat protein
MKKVILVMMILLMWAFVLYAYAQDVDTSIRKLSDPQTKQEGIKEIEQAGVAALPQLSTMAKDQSKNQGERIATIILLGKAGNKIDEKDPLKKQAREDLENILKNDQDQFAREAAALGLGYLGDKKAIPVLKERLDDENGNVRMRSALALAKLGDKSGKEKALQAIKDKDTTAQLLAIDVLEEIGDKDVVPTLENNISSPSSNAWTKVHSKLAVKRVQIKGLKGQQRLDALKNNLQDKQLEVNKWAARELGREIGEDKGNRKGALEILKSTSRDDKNEGKYSANQMLMILQKSGKVKEGELK